MARQPSSTGGLTVKISAALWLTWAQIAVEHEARADDARVALEANKAAGRSLDMNNELKSALVAISAATSAIEGMYGMYADPLPPDLKARWVTTKPRYQWLRVYEVLEHQAGMDDSYRTRLSELYKLRNPAIHHYERMQKTVRHPSEVLDTSVAPEYANYTVGSARRAVTLMADVATLVISNGAMREDKRAAFRKRVATILKARLAAP